MTKAIAAPRNSGKGCLNSALIKRIVIWVLSPSSANKMVINVDKNTPKAPEGGVELLEELTITFLGNRGQVLGIRD